MPDKRTELERGGKYDPSASRYAVQFTPVGWFVIDTVSGGDPAAQFGLGSDEYRLAKDEARRQNDAAA